MGISSRSKSSLPVKSDENKYEQCTGCGISGGGHHFVRLLYSGRVWIELRRDSVTETVRSDNLGEAYIVCNVIARSEAAKRSPFIERLIVMNRDSSLVSE